MSTRGHLDIPVLTVSGRGWGENVAQTLEAVGEAKELLSILQSEEQTLEQESIRCVLLTELRLRRQGPGAGEISKSSFGTRLM